MRYNFACVLAAHLDDNEGALKLLQSTVPMCTLSLLKIVETDTDLDPLRDDPRFQKLLRRHEKEARPRGGGSARHHAESRRLTPLALQFGAGVAAGLMIGIERGWRLRREKAGTRVAGVRTYTLVGTGGALGESCANSSIH